MVRTVGAALLHCCLALQLDTRLITVSAALPAKDGSGCGNQALRALRRPTLPAVRLAMLCMLEPCAATSVVLCMRAQPLESPHPPALPHPPACSLLPPPPAIPCSCDADHRRCTQCRSAIPFFDAIGGLPLGYSRIQFYLNRSARCDVAAMGGEGQDLQRLG